MIMLFGPKGTGQTNSVCHLAQQRGAAIYLNIVPTVECDVPCTIVRKFYFPAGYFPKLLFYKVLVEHIFGLVEHWRRRPTLIIDIPESVKMDYTLAKLLREQLKEFASDPAWDSADVVLVAAGGLYFDLLDRR